MKYFKTMLAIAASLLSTKPEAAAPAVVPEINHDHVYHIPPAPAPVPKKTRARWDISMPAQRKTASKLGTVNQDAIVKSSRPSGRKPTRAQRRASATK